MDVKSFAEKTKEFGNEMRGVVEKSRLVRDSVAWGAAVGAGAYGMFRFADAWVREGNREYGLDQPVDPQFVAEVGEFAIKSGLITTATVFSGLLLAKAGIALVDHLKASKESVASASMANLDRPRGATGLTPDQVRERDAKAVTLSRAGASTLPNYDQAIKGVAVAGHISVDDITQLQQKYDLSTDDARYELAVIKAAGLYGDAGKLDALKLMREGSKSGHVKSSEALAAIELKHGSKADNQQFFKNSMDSFFESRGYASSGATQLAPELAGAKPNNDGHKM